MGGHALGRDSRETQWLPGRNGGGTVGGYLCTAMQHKTPVERVRVAATKNIVLIAHDSKKKDLIEWVRFNRTVLERHQLFATGTTGSLIELATSLPVTCFRSGPLGGDQQVGAKIAEGDLDVLIFFWDPLEPQPHDPDVKAVLRIAVLCNIPTACNRATADFIVTSPLFHDEYDRLVEDHAAGRSAGRTAAHM
jgi:methylglyoxal synthase